MQSIEKIYPSRVYIEAKTGEKYLVREFATLTVIDMTLPVVVYHHVTKPFDTCVRTVESFTHHFKEPA
jgi:hypothetical protein